SHLYYLYSAATVFLVTIFAWAKLINFINMTKSFFLKNLNRFSRLNYLLLPLQQLSLFGTAKIEKLL
ncbi:TPA: hypothetical protein ACGZ9U_003204, partial [Elizabethkingia anophelis]